MMTFNEFLMCKEGFPGTKGGKDEPGNVPWATSDELTGKHPGILQGNLPIVPPHKGKKERLAVKKGLDLLPNNDTWRKNKDIIASTKRGSDRTH